MHLFLCILVRSISMIRPIICSPDRRSCCWSLQGGNDGIEHVCNGGGHRMQDTATLSTHCTIHPIFMFTPCLKPRQQKRYYSSSKKPSLVYSVLHTPRMQREQSQDVRRSLIFFPTSLCGVFVFGSESRPAASSSSSSSSAHRLCHTQLCHTILSHTISYTQRCHTQRNHTHTHTSFTHNFVTHTHFFTHNFVTHTHTPFFHTHNFVTHNFVTHKSFTNNFVTHTHTLSHNFVTHTNNLWTPFINAISTAISLFEFHGVTKIRIGLCVFAARCNQKATEKSVGIHKHPRDRRLPRGWPRKQPSTPPTK